VGVREHILSKADSLTPAEVGEIRRHCDIGYRIAMATGDLTSIADWILKHHEWWDGNGYPLHLRGEEIPLPSRMLAIVDAFDAMTSDRPYRKAMPRKEAMAEIVRCSGSQFDPSLVPKFLGTLEN
jgi:HD-GYP domain-containing protein (c-di-GMP phosphodiesterase class II)